MRNITPGESWNARISGKIAEAMSIQEKTRNELSGEISGNEQKWGRLAKDKNLWHLPFRDVALIAEAAGCELTFIYKRRAG